MDYQLLCADIDGTLTNSRSEVTPRTRRALAAAFAAGKRVTLSTGRPPRALRRFAALLPGAVPLICTNGATLASSADGTLLEEHRLPPEAVAALLEALRGRDITLALWQGETLWLEGDGETCRAYERGTDCPSRPLAEFLSLPDTSAGKLLVRGRPESVASCKQALTAEAFPAVEAFLSAPGTLEIIARGFHKGYGLLRCAAVLGLTPEQVIAVGDGENDIPMLTAAGLGVAMGNGGPDVAAHAALRAPGCDEDGLAWVIENYLLP